MNVWKYNTMWEKLKKGINYVDSMLFHRFGEFMLKRRVQQIWLYQSSIDLLHFMNVECMCMNNLPWSAQVQSNFFCFQFSS